MPATQVRPITRRDALRAGLIVPCLTSGVLSAAASFAGERASVTPFRYRAPQSALDHLRLRLEHTRWPERATARDWSQGVPLGEMRDLIEYWRTEYDWRRFERKLDSVDQFRTPLDGLDIHFIHVRSPHPKALPIIMTHGWPGSIVEFLDVVAPLTNPTAYGGRPEDAFHFIAPSLPGYGFSQKPTHRGWTIDRIAHAWGELMTRLGYRRYVAQGGDWGTFVTTRMAQLHVPGLIAIHLTMPQVIPDELPAVLTDEQKEAIEAQRRFETDQFGYFAIQQTRPQTLGYALADSPAGQAAWIYEKFHAWTDNEDDPEDALTRDQMLDNITLYWLTNTSASSARLYLEQAGIGESSNAGPVDLPVGVSLFPREIFRAPRDWAERLFSRLIYWNTPERGGHFAAFEEPEIFTREMRAFAAALRSK